METSTGLVDYEIEDIDGDRHDILKAIYDITGNNEDNEHRDMGKQTESVSEEHTAKERESARVHFKVVRFMFESGLKLRIKAIPLASAVTVYHRFFEECDVADYDLYLIATTALYIGHKLEESYVKLRDIINVCHRTLHPDKPPLDMGSTFIALRESIHSCELLMMRVLKFHLTFTHPHKYMLHYLKSVMDWLDPRVSEGVPIARTAWSLLNDSYHGKVCLRHPPEDVAVAVVYLSTQCHGIEVPYSHESQYQWYEILCDGISLQKIRQIILEIIDIYNLEVMVSS